MGCGLYRPGAGGGNTEAGRSHGPGLSLPSRGHGSRPAAGIAESADAPLDFCSDLRVSANRSTIRLTAVRASATTRRPSQGIVSTARHPVSSPDGRLPPGAKDLRQTGTPPAGLGGPASGPGDDPATVRLHQARDGRPRRQCDTPALSLPHDSHANLTRASFEAQVPGHLNLDTSCQREGFPAVDQERSPCRGIPFRSTSVAAGPSSNNFPSAPDCFRRDQCL
jgi:hypothetical protein